MEPMGLMVKMERKLSQKVEVVEVVLEEAVPLRVVMEVIMLQMVNKVVEILVEQVLVDSMDIQF